MGQKFRVVETFEPTYLDLYCLRNLILQPPAVPAVCDRRTAIIERRDNKSPLKT
jgi:hypothetical protein